MKFLTTKEAKSWCQVRGLKVTADEYLYYEPLSPLCVTIGLEDKPSSLIGLLDRLVPTWEEAPFEGALLWIRERGIWGDHSEKTGEVMIEQMRLGKGESETLEERPAHLLAPDEVYETQSYLLMPMLFGWDAFLIPDGKDYFHFVSHDGLVCVVCRTQETYEELATRTHVWNPRDDKGWYIKHISTSTGM